MGQKTNGSGLNGSGGNDRGKLLHFPSVAERLKRKKPAPDKPGKPGVPFFNFSNIPPFTRALVAALVIIHIILHCLLPLPMLYDIFDSFGFEPAYYTGVRPFRWEAIFAPVTHLFIHGNAMHVGFNAMMALVTGMFFEREYGARATAFFFFACGIAGALFYFVIFPFSTVPVIGASDSLSGLFGAMIMIFFQRPHMRGIAGKRLSKYGPWPLVIFWLLLMTVMGLLSGESLAWQAHIGGFLSGILFLRLMQKGKLKFLF